MANFCRNCGTKLNPAAKFCPNCGQKISVKANTNDQGGITIEASKDSTTAVSKEATAETPKKEPAAKKRTPAAKQAPAMAGKTASSGRTATANKENVKTNAKEPVPTVKKKKSGVSLLLVVTLLAGFLFTAYKYPGFLVKKPDKPLYTYQTGTGSMTGTSETGTASGHAESNSSTGDVEQGFVSATRLTADSSYGTLVREELAQLTEEELRDLSPGNPAYIDIRVSDEEIASIEPLTATVSPENPICTIGDITVNFKEWNLEEEDTLELRVVGSRTDSGGEISLNLFDFNMASGDNTFATDVEITLPRSQNGDANGVVWYNPETDEWEPTAYDISEDGKNYILYIDHFTLLGPEAASFIKGDTLSTAWGRGIFCTGLGDSKNQISKQNLLRQSLYVSDEKMTELYKKEILDKDKFIHSLFRSEGDIDPEASLSQGVHDLFGGIGDFDMLNSIPGVFQQNAELWSGMGNWFLGASVLYTIAKISWAIYKDQGWWKTLSNYKIDIAGGIIGIIGAVAGAYVGTPAVVVGCVCAAVSVAMYWIDKMLSVDLYRVSYQSDAYWYYMNYQYRRPNGKMLTLNGSGWADALKDLVETATPENGERLIENFYDNYLNYFWDQLTVQDREKAMVMWNDLNHQPSFSWKDPTPEVKEKIIQNTEEMLKGNTQLIVFDIYQTYINKCVVEYKKKIQNEALRYLNSYLVFSLVDKSLGKDVTFDQSPYCPLTQKAALFSESEDHPIQFRFTKEPGKGFDFWPADMAAADYDPKAFCPVVRDNSNIVFACRRYYYLMYGCPQKIFVPGVEAANLGDILADFTVDSNKIGAIPITIELHGGQNKTFAPNNHAFIRSENSPDLDANFQDIFGYAFLKSVVTLNESGQIRGFGNHSYTVSNHKPEMNEKGERKIEESDLNYALEFTIEGSQGGTCTITGTARYKQSGRHFWQIGQVVMDDTTTSTDYSYSFSGTGRVDMLQGMSAMFIFDDVTVTRKGQSTTNDVSSPGEMEWHGTFDMRYFLDTSR